MTKSILLLKNKKMVGITSLFLGFQFALCIYLNWVPYPFIAYRSLFLIISLTILFSAGIFSLLSRWILPRFRQTTRTVLILCFLLSVLWAAFLILIRAISLPDRSFFLPDGSVMIENILEKNPASIGNRIELKLFDSGTTDSFKAFSQTGNWYETETSLFTDEVSSLAWSGQVFHQISLLFTTGPDAGIVRLSWDDEVQDFDLYAEEPGELSVTHEFPLPWINRVIIFLAILSGVGFLFFIFFALVVPVSKRKVHARQGRIVPWWIFAIPMITVWLLWLLVFWPGLMSPDSIDQWSQSLSSVFNDWHPAIYAIIMRILNRIWETPAVIGLLQILCLSLVTSWGLHALWKVGVPKKVCWAMSALFAVIPLNALFSITLWKDIPYGISLFALFLMVLQIVLSDGDWLKSWKQKTGLAVASAGVMLFRHNGAPVVLLAILALILFFPKIRRGLMQTSIGLLILFFLIKVPLYQSLRVTPNGMGGINQLYLHHISAHVEAETPLSASEEAYLNQLLPLDEWTYYPCNVDTLKFQSGIDLDLLYSQPQKNLEVFLSLARKAPAVNLKHIFEANKMIWQIQPGGCYLYRVPLFKNTDNSFHWIESNSIGIAEDSKIPGWISPFFDFYARTASVPWIDSFVWRPAMTTYLSFLVCMAMALRFQKKKTLLIGLVPLLQFGMMLVLTFAQDMRFQYGNMLIGLFSIGLLFIPVPESEPQTES